MPREQAALEHLTRCWALELAPQGVRVNAVAAGPAETAALVEMMGLSPEQAEGVKEHERKLIPMAILTRWHGFRAFRDGD